LNTPKNSLYPGKIRIIGGQWRGRFIKVLNRVSLRPTPDRVRETLFNWLAPKIVDARCLDCFAGTGILSFEALSRGAQHATLLDTDRMSIEALKNSRSMLGIAPQLCDIIQQDAVLWLKHQGHIKQVNPYDIIFLDAPFASELLMQTLILLENTSLLSPAGWVYVEMSVESNALLLPGWRVLKSKQAAKVVYQLLAKEY